VKKSHGGCEKKFSQFFINILVFSSCTHISGCSLYWVNMMSTKLCLNISSHFFYNVFDAQIRKLAFLGLNIVHTHIFREGNICADKLVSHGHFIADSTWWDSIPSFLYDSFLHDKLGLPCYRFD
jgi:hypothetical protein